MSFTLNIYVHCYKIVYNVVSDNKPDRASGHYSKVYKMFETIVGTVVFSGLAAMLITLGAMLRW